MLPRSTADHYRRTQRLQAVLLLGLRRAWARMNPAGDWEAQYRDDVGPKVLALVLAAQAAAAQESDRYVTEILLELDLDRSATPGVVRPTGYVGVAGDGRPVDTLLAIALIAAKQDAIRQREAGFLQAVQLPDVDAALEAPTIEISFNQALLTGQKFLELASHTLIADTTRAAESAALTTYPSVSGYVRMLNPPSCSRCVILAGKWFRWNQGFDRHPGNPGCDCIHIPARESDTHDLRVNPAAYFRSLDPADQDRTFTAAGAKAIRDGADIGQVVNARRGMSTAQVNEGGWGPRGRLVPVRIGRRDAFVSSEGTTRRGLASRARTGRHMVQRIMPETIYDVAADRDDAIRLLRLNGFIN